jgi:hypothetical protein
MNLIYLFLPGILLLGIVTTYTDLKEGKIRNKHIIMAVVYSLAAYILLTILNWGSIRIGYFIELFIMCGLSLIMGFIMWYVGLWTAGDAKLFFAYSMLVPLSVYKHGHIPYFDSTTLLINTVVPISVYLSIDLMFKTSLKQKLLFLKGALHPEEVFSLAISLFAFLWVTTFLFKLINLPMNYFVGTFLLLIVVMLFEKIFSPKLFKLVIIIISVLRFIFDKSIYSYYFVEKFLLFLALFVILRFFIIKMGFLSLTKKTDLGLLREGMVPAEVICKNDGKYEKQDWVFFSVFDHFQERISGKDYLFDPTQPLTKQDINKISALRKKLGFKHLRIQQTLPFAPFLFFGILLTLLINGDVISLFLRFIS